MKIFTQIALLTSLFGFCIPDTYGQLLVPESNGGGDEMIYLGKFKQSRNFDENDYYISINPTVWATARSDCQARVGDILTLDSKEESNFIISKLDDYGYGLNYWTAGTYDAGQGVWRWATSGKALPEKAPKSWAPWAPNYPPSNPNSLHRVIIRHDSQFESYWETRPHSQRHRYICEASVNSKLSARKALD